MAGADLWVYNAENLFVSFLTKLHPFHLGEGELKQKGFWSYLCAQIFQSNVAFPGYGYCCNPSIYVGFQSDFSHFYVRLKLFHQNYPVEQKYRGGAKKMDQPL